MKIVALFSLFALLCPSDVFAGVHRLDASLKQYPISRRSPPYVGRVAKVHRSFYWTMSEKKAVRDYYEDVLLCSMTVGTQGEAHQANMPRVCLRHRYQFHQVRAWVQSEGGGHVHCVVRCKLCSRRQVISSEVPALGLVQPILELSPSACYALAHA